MAEQRRNVWTIERSVDWGITWEPYTPPHHADTFLPSRAEAVERTKKWVPAIHQPWHWTRIVEYRRVEEEQK